MLRSAAKTRCSSRKLTLRPCQDRIAWLKLTSGLARLEERPQLAAGQAMHAQHFVGGKIQVSDRSRSRRTIRREPGAGVSGSAALTLGRRPLGGG